MSEQNVWLGYFILFFFPNNLMIYKNDKATGGKLSFLKMQFINVQCSRTDRGFFRLLQLCLCCRELVDRMQVCSAAYWDFNKTTNCFLHPSVCGSDRTQAIRASYSLSTSLKNSFNKNGCITVGNTFF